MAAFTPFNRDEDIGTKTSVIVCSYGPDNAVAVQEIERWAREHGYVRGGEHHLNSRRNLDGRRYFYSACYLEEVPSGDTSHAQRQGGHLSGRDKNTPLSSASLIREQAAEIGTHLFEQHIRPLLQDSDFGKYVSVDVRANVPLEYEIGSDLLTTAERILTRRPDAILYTVRVGYPAVVTMRRWHTRGAA